MRASPSPPSLMLWIGARVLGRQNRDYILGDLIEAFEADRGRVGVRAAAWNLRRELGATVFWDACGRVRETGRLIVSGEILARGRATGGRGVLAMSGGTHRKAYLRAAATIGVLAPMLATMGWLGRSTAPRFHLETFSEGSDVTPMSSGHDLSKVSILMKPVVMGGWQDQQVSAVALFSLPQAQERLRPTVVLGRLLAVGDERAELPAAVITEAAWRSRFGASDAVLGTALRLDEVEVLVVGVVSMEFDWPMDPPEVWVALPPQTVLR